MTTTITKSLHRPLSLTHSFDHLGPTNHTNESQNRVNLRE